MRSIIAAFLLAIVPSAFASGLRFDPPAPDSHSFVQVTVGGFANGCIPRGATVTRTGNSFLIHYPNPYAGHPPCPPSFFKWSETFPLGVLGPGVYDVHVSVDGPLLIGSVVFTDGMVEVRDADAQFQVVPAAVPSNGETEVLLLLPRDYANVAWVSFGSSPGIQAFASGDMVSGFEAFRIVPPPHAPGAVDVVVYPGVADVPQRTLVSHTSFVYVDPAAPVNEFAFEPLLFPIAYTGGGAFGSQWTTVNTVSGGDSAAVFRSPLPCAGCTSVLAETQKLQITNDAAGQLLWIARGPQAQPFASSRIIETTRQSGTGGIGVPVVRESDFRFGSTTLLDLPNVAGARTMLRIWVLGGPGRCWYDVNSSTKLGGAGIVPLVTRASDGLSFGSVDLTLVLSHLPAGDTANVRIAVDSNAPDTRVWAMASITNNDTQQTTIIAPR